MYSEELIKEVKEVYPESKEIHRLADTGSVWLGRYLDDSSSGGISIKEVLEAKTLEEIQNVARLRKRKVDLYIKWGKEDPRKPL